MTDIYGHGKNIQKSKAYGSLVAIPGVFSTHNAIEKSVHTRKRRLLGQGFTETALRSAEPFIRKHLRSWCTALIEANADGPKSSDKWSEPRDMSTLSMNIPCLLNQKLTTSRYILYIRCNYRTRVWQVDANAQNYSHALDT